MQTQEKNGFDIQSFIRDLEAKTITQNDLKNKLSRINQISAEKQHLFVDDVRELYHWLIVFNKHRDYKDFIHTQKVQKQFLCDYLHQFVRYLMYCRQFRLEEMMRLCKDIIRQSINFFLKYFDEVQKYPHMMNIIKACLELERLFFKLNFQDTRLHLIPPLDKQQDQKVAEFIKTLTVGQKVDALKNDYSTSRKIWSIAKIVKIGSQSIVVAYDEDKRQNQKPLSRYSFEIFPEGTFTNNKFQWRKNLKVGDEIDYEFHKTFWKKFKITEIENQKEDQRQYQIITVIDQNGKQYLLSPVSPSVQPPNTFSRDDIDVHQDYHLKGTYQDESPDDYNDILLQRGEYTKAGVLRHEVSSRFYLQLLNYFQSLKGFQNIINKIKSSNIHIDFIMQSLQVVHQLSVSFHRRYALNFLPRFIDSVVASLLNLSQSNIRMFNKQKFNMIIENIFNITKRYLTVRQRHHKLSQVKMHLIKVFIQSQFLDRKLNSITILTDLIKQSKKQNQLLKVDQKELQQWFIENDIFHKIYHESSHPQLISRSSQLLKLYLGSNPSISILQPLLKQLSQPVIKVISENTIALPAQFLQKVSTKLSNDPKLVLTQEVLFILKRVGGYQNWALQRGGQGWVELVKSKKNRKNDIEILFQQQLDVICRVFIQMLDKDPKLSSLFMNYAHNIGFIGKIIDSQVDINKKLQFLKYFYRELDQIDDQSQQSFQKLWNLTFNLQNNKNFLQTFKNIVHILTTKQRLTFAKNCFTIDKLKDLSLGGFAIFKKVINSINNSQLDFINSNQTPYGIDKILEIVFENEKIEVTKMALQFIFTVIDNLDSQAEITKFKQNLLDKCLNRLYETKNYQKYLSILQGILNQSQKSGNGGLEPVAKQFPSLPLMFTIHNHFNHLNKNKFYLTANSSITLYQLRYIIGKNINAYSHQIRLTCSSNNSQYSLQQFLNGLTLQQIGIHKTLLVTKKGKIKRVDLIHDNKLVNDAVLIVSKMFDQYSMDGLMSKQNCRRLIKRLGEESMIMMNHKVDKIFESYDTDKDEHLKVSDLIAYFEHVATVKPSNAWSMLESIGARQDLKTLHNVELTQPKPQTLPRYLLIKNQQFMKVLLELITKDDKNGLAAWNLLFRLPLHDVQNISKDSKFSLRYWLYYQDYHNKSDLDSQIFTNVINSDQQTLLIGLKVAQKINLEMNIDQLQVLLTRVQRYNQQKHISSTHQLILGFSLKLICKGLEKGGNIQQFLLAGNIKIQEIFMNGLLSKNTTLRRPYLEAINGILQRSKDSNPVLFKRLYVMLEKGLENQLSLLTPEYFELFSRLLIFASNKSQFIDQAQSILEKIIKAFEEHQSTQVSLISSEDQISIGFIKLIHGLLLSSGIRKPGIIQFLVNECLFPKQETERSKKLRNGNSRRYAYELIIILCRNNNQSLKELFESNFKHIYKKAYRGKESYWAPRVRSEYGFAGIQNLGCICYMISMIQQFFMVPAFRYLIMAADDGVPAELVKIQQPQQPYFYPAARVQISKQQKIIDDNVLHQFQALFANLQLTEKQQADPTNFCLSFKDFDNNPVNVMIQQDAQEFLNMLFDKLENGIKITPFKNIIQNIYGGKYCTQLTCSSCKKVSERFQNFFSLSLEVKGQKDIYESFAKYIEGEVISQYKCQGCNKKADTTKHCYISELPNYLILHLQRICFNYDKFENQKINSRLEFPFDLDIYPYTLQATKLQNKPSTTQQYQYKLKGIVVHIGGAEYGHYFSYIRGDNGQWLQYNDDNVRQFDPSDIEMEAFGGGNNGWRKEMQNAYLLMYEKVKKSQIKLQFTDQQQKQQIMKIIGATQIIKKVQEAQIEVQAPIQPKPLQRQQRMQQEKRPLIQQNKQLQNKQKQKTVEQKQPPKVITYIDPNIINQYTKPQNRLEIQKLNQKFALDIHLTSIEFLEFIYYITMLTTTDPNIKAYLLELSSETYSSSQPIVNGSILLSEVMPKRFNQLIEGGGWQFYLEKSQKWIKDILSPQSSVRGATKNMMIATITDIFKNITPKKQNHLQQFLLQFWQLSKGQDMEWYIDRAEQYFEFWTQILEFNPGMMNFFEKNKSIADLLRFIINDKNFPTKVSKKRKYFDYYNDQPLLFILVLIEKGYDISKHQFKGIASYGFLSKLINQSPSTVSTIAKLCQNNSLVSERVIYLLMISFTKANHSNQIKPLSQIVKKVLSIEDGLKKLRKEWLFGHPQLTQHNPGQSLGFYGLTAPDEQIRVYYSPLGPFPIPQSLSITKYKFEHVTILIITMLLELERDGFINLRAFPSQQPLQRDYTHWFDKYISEYKPAQGDNYKQYRNRVVQLWRNRQEKQLQKDVIDTYIVGKILKETPLIRQAQNNISTHYKNSQTQNRRVQMKETQYIVYITKPEYDEDGYLVHGFNLVQKYNTTTLFKNEEQNLALIENSSMFLKKMSTQYDKQEVQEEQPLESPFKNAFECDYIRKIRFCNQSEQSRSIVLKLTFLTDNPNMNFPSSPCRFSLSSQQDIYFTMTKIDPLKQWPQYIIQWDQAVEKYERFHSKQEEPPKYLFTMQSDQESGSQSEEDEENDDDDMSPKGVGEIW